MKFSKSHHRSVDDGHLETLGTPRRGAVAGPLDVALSQDLKIVRVPPCCASYRAKHLTTRAPAADIFKVPPRFR